MSAILCPFCTTRVVCMPGISCQRSRSTIQIHHDGCGVAWPKDRCPLAGGRDFVGACINLASRVQKLGKLGFSVLATGFDLSRVPAERLRDVLVKKRTQVRLSDQQSWELVYVVKSEFEALEPKDKADFVDP